MTTVELARRHAPLWRFNAWIPGDSSPMNKSEDHFPQSVARYFEELASGKARVVTREGRGGPRPGENALRALEGPVSMTADAILGVPRNMAGDAPSEAPLYFHATRKGELTYIEYWVFYPMDRCRVKVLGITLPLGGHRGDWEGISLALDARGKVVRGYFERHGEKDVCTPDEMRFEGEHPVVYVSQGKHAAYPEPGRWHDVYGFAPLMQFDEFFFGNGCAWRSWETPLVDLDGPRREFESRFTSDWRDFKGGWGPDKGFLKVLAASPEGPRQHGIYGSLDAGAKKWSEVRKKRGLDIHAVAPVLPPPVPIRR